MITYNMHKNNIYIVLEYLFAIFTILQCDSIYIFSFGYSKIVINILWQILLLCLIVYPSIHFHCSMKFIIFISFFSIIFISFMIFESFYYPSFGKKIIVDIFIDPILLIIYFIKNENYGKCKKIFYFIEKFIFILSIISIIFWIMENIHVSPTSSLMTSGWYTSNGASITPSYFDVGFIVKSESSLLGVKLLRNTGIFVEPSIYAFVINIAILIELFIKNNKKILNYKIIFLFIVLLSTASTTSIVFILIALIYKLLILEKSKIYTIAFIPVILIFLYYVFINKINDNSKVVLGSSYSIRMDDIHACLLAWKNHLIVGNGIGNATPILSHMSSWRFLVNNTGISAGLPAVLATGGLILGMFYILPIILSLFMSPMLIGLAIFSITPLIFVSLQSNCLTIMIISYIFACYITNEKTYLNLKVDDYYE